MLSIGAMAGGQTSYYLDLAREDYYLDGGEPPGRWWGRGAEQLSLAGTVERQDLESVFSGFDRHGRGLVQNAGTERHQFGWDLTFSAPKSVSLAWVLGDAETRNAIQQAHHAATAAALSYLEDTASFSRRGQGGAERISAGLVVATFEHGTSRALDPQLHTHCLVMNVTVGSDGRTATLVSKPLYRHKMTAGAIYRAELSAQLARTLGFQAERKRSWFELAGVPSGVLRHFSTRRAQIEKQLGKLGLETASAAAFAALDTREVKDVVPPRSQLLRDWRDAAAELGFGLRDVMGLRGRAKEQDLGAAYREAYTEALEQLTEKKNFFSEQELLRTVAVCSQGKALDASYLRGWVSHDLQSSSDLLSLGEHDGEERYTTQEILRTERELLALAEHSKQDRSHAIADRVTLGRVLADNQHLSPEQCEVVRSLTEDAGGVQLLTGFAGTGKTSTLNAARDVWQRAGYTVYGASVSGKAALELQLGAGIDSTTLKLLELRMKPSLEYRLKHHARQLARAALKKPTYKLTPVRFDAKTVLVIDEASMVPTKQLLDVARAVREAGGKLVLAGDARQLPAIEHPGAFAALEKSLGAATLTGIVRQRDEADRDVVRQVARGAPDAALESLAERGRVTVAKDRDGAIDELVSDWMKQASAKPQDALVFCGTREEVAGVNARIQTERALAGQLDTSNPIPNGDARLFPGDRVRFTKNSYKLGVRNGQLATILSATQKGDAIAAKLDTGEHVVVPLKTYKHDRGPDKGQSAVSLGYAVTTHAGQGTTVEQAFILAGGPMTDLPLSYVQLSRARDRVRLYTDEQEAGQDLTDLARRMERPADDQLAQDLLERKEQGLDQTL